MRRLQFHKTYGYTLILCGVLFLLPFILSYKTQTQLSHMIRFGGYHHENAVSSVKSDSVHIFEKSYGYDGQFYAQMALDPLFLKNETMDAMDAPAYRARRVFLSACAYLLGIGKPSAILFAYSILNLLFWIGLGVLVANILSIKSPWSFLQWIGCMFSLGSVSSVMLALTDLPATMLSLLAIYWASQQSTKSAALAFSVSMLTKETSLLAGLGTLDLKGPLKKNWILCLSPLPLIAWILYLKIRGFPAGVGSPANFTYPFGGLLFELTSTLQYLKAGKVHNALALWTLLYQIFYLLKHHSWHSHLWRFALPYIALILMLGQAVWEGDPGAAYRVALPITIAFNLLLKPSKAFLVHWIMGNLSMLISIKYLFKIAVT